MNAITIDYKYIIEQLRPGEEFEWENGAPSAWSSVGEWQEATNPPTKKDCDDYWNNVLYKKLHNERNLALRSQAYPPVEAQLDAIYWDLQNQTSIWQDTITGIKQRYPLL